MNKEHKEFLDNLRESGETNMFGALSYLVEEFELDKKEARAILSEWFDTFNLPERATDGEWDKHN